ncbi:MAG: serine hydrolase [Clostridia bacterium]|nr:serine hydrolase [Clostridia bacterium]
MKGDLGENLRTLCDGKKLLCGLSVAFGTAKEHESLLYGCRRTAVMTQEGIKEDPLPLEEDSLFDIASLTKFFCLLLLLRLKEEGRLRLDDEIPRLDARFHRLSGVTVGDVLCYGKHLSTPLRVDTAESREEGLRRLFDIGVAPRPAVRLYSDMNAMVLKYVCEAASGLAFYEALKRCILSPLGLCETFAAVPEALRGRIVSCNLEHQILGEDYVLRTDILPGTPHDPKARLLSMNGEDLCGHAGLFSTHSDLVLLCSGLLSGELLSRETLMEIGKNRTGIAYPDGTHRQYLGMICHVKHPNQYYSEVPAFMTDAAFGLSGFTGHHLSMDPVLGCFVLYLGSRCHMHVSRLIPPPGRTLQDYGPGADGSGRVRWPDGRLVPSSASWVHFKDEWLHTPVEAQLRKRGWLPA